MQIKKRLAAASAAGALVLGSLLVAAPTASANALCTWGSYGHTTARTWTTGNGQCIQVSARSTLNVSNQVVYTSWSYGQNYAEAGGNPYVQSGYHGHQPFTNKWYYAAS